MIGFDEVPTWFPLLPLPMPDACEPSPIRLYVLPNPLTRPITSPPRLLPAISELTRVRSPTVSPSLSIPPPELPVIVTSVRLAMACAGAVRAVA